MSNDFFDESVGGSCKGRYELVEEDRYAEDEEDDNEDRS
jgi:hypothetical protein